MLSWEDAPESAGPVSEAAAGGGAALDVQALAQHSVRLPQLDQEALRHGEYVPLRGEDPYRPSPEQVARERAEASRRYEVREAAERAAIAAGQSALEAAATADKLIREAQETARKVSG